MSIIFFNNWKTAKEFHLIEISYVSFKNPNQVGFTFCLLGLGIIMVKNI